MPPSTTLATVRGPYARVQWAAFTRASCRRRLPESSGDEDMRHSRAINRWSQRPMRKSARRPANTDSRQNSPGRGESVVVATARVGTPRSPSARSASCMSSSCRLRPSIRRAVCTSRVARTVLEDWIAARTSSAVGSRSSGIQGNRCESRPSSTVSTTRVASVGSTRTVAGERRRALASVCSSRTGIGGPASAESATSSPWSVTMRAARSRSWRRFAVSASKRVMLLAWVWNGCGSFALAAQRAPLGVLRPAWKELLDPSKAG